MNAVRFGRSQSTFILCCVRSWSSIFALTTQLT